MGRQAGPDLGTQWKAWRQRLRGDQDELAAIFHITKPQGHDANEYAQRLALAAAVCDAALFMIWHPELGSASARKLVRPSEQDTSLLDLSPARIVRSINRLMASGIADPEFAGFTRHEFDSCWHGSSRFRRDLFRYLFRPEVYLARALEAQSEIRDLFEIKDDFQEFVVAATEREMRSATEDKVVALGALVAASLPWNLQIRELIATIDRYSSSAWSALYREALDHYGRRLKDGLQIEDFSRLATMLTEGALAQARLEKTTSDISDMRAGIQLIVDAFLARSEHIGKGNTLKADTNAVARYRRHVLFNDSLVLDEHTLIDLQRAHLDTFAYSNLDTLLGEHYYDLHNFLDRLMSSRHGGLCYQLNYSLSLILRAVGFDVDYLWGTVSSTKGQKGSPEGNHLGLRVRIGGKSWLVDAGLGDGPRTPIVLTPGVIHQEPFTYEVMEGPESWTLVHDEAGSFAEVVFAKKAVDLSAFREPAREQAESPQSGFLKTLTVMRRQEHAAAILRGRTFHMIDDKESEPQTVESQRQWADILKNEFQIYLGNIGLDQRDRLWRRVCVAHEQWLKDEEEKAT